jgi:hypothetical protein
MMQQPMMQQPMMQPPMMQPPMMRQPMMQPPMMQKPTMQPPYMGKHMKHKPKPIYSPMHLYSTDPKMMLEGTYTISPLYGFASGRMDVFYKGQDGCVSIKLFLI